MSEGFSQKEMLIRILDKLDSMEVKLNETHEQAIQTNGKVRLHTKLITWIGGILVAIIGWIVSIVVK